MAKSRESSFGIVENGTIPWLTLDSGNDGDSEETFAKTVLCSDISDEMSIQRPVSSGSHRDSVIEMELSINETAVKEVADSSQETRLKEVRWDGTVEIYAVLHPDVPSSKPLPSNKLYHAFFSYHVLRDGPWVRRLISKLEDTHGYKCCDHERDFTPGWTILENITQCVMSSVKTVVVMSPESVKSGWCSYEAELSLHMSNDMRRKILIPVMVEDCEIPSHLKPLTYIDARGDASVWWPKLLAALDSPGMPSIFLLAVSGDSVPMYTYVFMFAYSSKSRPN
jgi:hypothetical protein